MVAHTPTHNRSIQSWVLQELQPDVPIPYNSDPPNHIVRVDGQAVYKQYGDNYQMGSRSSRLQPLPLLTSITNDTWPCRFPSNPSIVEYPSRDNLSVPAADGTQEYLLSVQLGSAHIERHKGDLDHVKYDTEGNSYIVQNVAMKLSIRKERGNGKDQYFLNFSEQALFSHYKSLDMRLVAFNGTLVMPGGQVDAGIVVLDQARMQNASSLWRGSWITFDYDDLEGQPLSKQKNWMAVVADVDLYWIVHFAPFTVAWCGNIGNWLPKCRLHAYSDPKDSLMPEDVRKWRGSSPTLPLPGFPSLAIGSVHQRADPASHKSSKPFRDSYMHRFFLVDTNSWKPFAFTEQFSLFAHNDDVNWFEFITGQAFHGSDLILTFGYNDQEPWLAILPLAPIIQYLQPAYAHQTTALAAVKAKFEA